MSDNAQWLRDRVEIEELAYLFAKATDEGSHLFDLCLAEDVEMVYDFGSWRGREEHKRVRDGMPAAFTFTQHAVSNPIIEVEGDVGRGHFYVVATHGVAGEDGKTKAVVAMGTYALDVARTLEGWRIKRLRCEIRWVDDQEALMRAASSARSDATAASATR